MGARTNSKTQLEKAFVAWLTGKVSGEEDFVGVKILTGFGTEKILFPCVIISVPSAKEIVVNSQVYQGGMHVMVITSNKEKTTFEASEEIHAARMLKILDLFDDIDLSELNPPEAGEDERAVTGIQIFGLGDREEVGLNAADVDDLDAKTAFKEGFTTEVSWTPRDPAIED